MEQCKIFHECLNKHDINYKNFFRTYVYMKNYYSRYPNIVRPLLADNKGWDETVEIFELIPPIKDFVVQKTSFEFYLEIIGDESS